MSAKNSFNSMDPKAMQALLAVASKKLGTTPDVLKGQLESGVYDRALQGMPQNEAMMLQKALSEHHLLSLSSRRPHRRQGRYSKSSRENSIWQGKSLNRR